MIEILTTIFGWMLESSIGASSSKFVLDLRLKYQVNFGEGDASQISIRFFPSEIVREYKLPQLYMGNAICALDFLEIDSDPLFFRVWFVCHLLLFVDRFYE